MNASQVIRPIELLAPARDAETAIEAIKCGADAVYMGSESHGARVAAGNSVDDIARVVDFAHQYNARVYVTLNTIIYDNEIDDVKALIGRLYDVGVDALIVQDMSVLRMDIPPIALHASTQCDTRDACKARFLQDVGFSQIVIARELSLDEIKKISDNVTVPIEAFVHGALCVSYSGDCQASHYAMGRSANRGECAQMCRLPYSLVDAKGRTLIENKHLLSLRDMNRSHYLEQMMDAGVSSFKIEGRLKDVGYVKNVVAFYRKRIDEIIASRSDCYCRSSVGYSEVPFEPRLEKSFNRGFTPYFLNGEKTSIASIDTPKSRGERVAKVKRCYGREIEVVADVQLNNGDGIGYFDEKGEFAGFRLNKVEGNRFYLTTSVRLAPGTVLYRNRDKQWDDMLEADVCRLIDVKMSLTRQLDGVLLTVSDCRGNVVSKELAIALEEAKSPQEASRQRVLTKVGNTIYRVSDIDDKLGNVFVPASVLTQLRRDVLEMLDSAQRENYSRDTRGAENRDVQLPQGQSLTYHDNVANEMACEFYVDHGASKIERAVEVDMPQGRFTVMTTRYCVRREMGKCLKTSAGREWEGPLYLTSANHRFALDFDCKQCQMKVLALGDAKNND